MLSMMFPYVDLPMKNKFHRLQDEIHDYILEKRAATG